MKRIKIFLFVCLFICCSFTTRATNRLFRWPLSINNGYSASFQEFRGNHFHGGIDIRTFQKTGFPVYSVSQGLIFKIRCVRRGSGKGIYIKHKNGYVSIYYHLSRFNSILEKIFNKVKRSKGKYFGSYTLKKPIRIKRGGLIGYSGETGSGFPHLHLEIRDENYNAVNPFKLLDFPGDDKNLPVIPEIIFRSVGRTKINNENGEIRILVPKKGKSNYLKDPVYVDGEFEIILNANDIADTGRRVSPVSISAFLNQKEFFRLGFEKFKRDDNNQLGFVYDMFYSTVSNFYFNLFYQTGYKLEKQKNDIYSIFKMLKNGENNLKIEVMDNFSNKDLLFIKIVKKEKRNNIFDSEKEIDIKKKKDYLSSITNIDTKVFINRDKVSLKINDENLGEENIFIKIQNCRNPEILKPFPEKGGFFFNFNPPEEKNVSVIDFFIKYRGKLLAIVRKNYHFITLKNGVSKSVLYGDFEADFSVNSVYENRVVAISTKNYSSEFPQLSSQIKIYPFSFPFLDKVWFKFHKKIVNPEQAGIFSYSVKKNRWTYKYTYINKDIGIFKTRQLSGGIFALMRDNIPPEISMVKPASSYRKYLKQLIIYIYDKGKGIDAESVKIFLNDKKTDAEYDPDRKWVILKDIKDLLKLKLNKLKVSAKDSGGNYTERVFSFYLR